MTLTEIPKLQARFDSKHKMSRIQLETLFPGYEIDKQQFRFLEKGLRNVLIFDIESINFDARMGFVICWYALKWDILTGKTKMYYDRLEKSDMEKQYKLRKFDFDTRLLGSLSRIIKESDLIAGHYISKFDLPYFTARCHLTGQDELVPDYNDCKVMDTWRITKMKYNLYQSGGNSLRNAGKVVVGYDDKTSVDLDIWKGVYYADSPDWNKNMKYICNHCEIDVEQNFELFKKELKRVPIGGSSI